MARRKSSIDTSQSLKELTIQGFKGFEIEARVPLRPLTIIMGENNSGKSAILKAIASLGQTKIHKRATGDSNDWVASGPWFDLGPERSFINAKNPNQSFKIALESEAYGLTLEYKVNEEDRFACDLEKVSLRIDDEEYIGEKQTKLLAENPKLEQLFGDRENPFYTFHRMRRFNRDFSSDNESYFFRKKSIDIESIVNILESISDFFKMVDENDEFDFPQKRDALIELYSKFGKELEIPPKYEDLVKIIKEDPQKASELMGPMAISTFTGPAAFSDFSMSSNEPFGKVTPLDFIMPRLHEPLVEFLLEKNDLGEIVNEFRFAFEPLGKANRVLVRVFGSQFMRNVTRLLDSEYLGAFRLEPKRVYDIRNRSEPYYKTMQILCLSDDKTLGKINKSLSELVNVKIFPKPLRSETSLQDQATQFFEVTVGKTKNQATLHLSDVGYGISQLLPVLSHLNSESILILEEAESNLHPKAQSKLMESIVSNLNDKDPNPQIIMESHSEHFLLRIQQLISEGKFRDDQVALIFVRKDPKLGTIVHHAETYQGDFIEELPESFEFYENYNPTGSII